MTSITAQRLLSCFFPYGEPLSKDEGDQDERTALEDEVSTSSTWSSPSRGDPLPRRVRFTSSTIQREIHEEGPISAEILGPLLVPSSEMTTTEKRTLWYRRSELGDFLAQALACAKECQRRHLRQATGSNGLPQTASLLKAFQVCYKGGENVQEPPYNNGGILYDWSRESPSFRGLERCILFGTNYSNRTAYIQVMLKVQRAVQSSVSPGDESAEEYLRSVSMHLTRGSRKFASLLGEADAKVASELASSNESRDWKPSFVRRPKLSRRRRRLKSRGAAHC